MTDHNTAIERSAQPSDLVVVAGLTRKQVALVKRTICAGYSDDELQLYLYQCEKMGLDPLARETYTFKAGDKVVIGISIDGFRRRADETGRYAPGKPTEYTYDPEGKLESARVWVRKLVGSTWHDVSEDAYLSEFRGKGKWGAMPRVMLSKCAEARCLRRAFPAKFTGLYAPEERAAIERNSGPAANPDPFAPPPAQADHVEVEAEVVDTPQEPTDGPYAELQAICQREGHTEAQLFAALEETGHAAMPLDALTQSDCDEILTAIERAKGV